MQLSRGALYFHRLFTVAELGLGSPEPFMNRIIREFLKVGIHDMEPAVAARWIEMPHGILLFQMNPGDPASGAIYLYDRRQRVFYMIGFDGADDNLTLADFDQLLSEYGLLRYAEQPKLIQAHVNAPALPVKKQPPALILSVDEFAHLLAGHALFRHSPQSFGQFYCHTLGSA